jgi:hypothetical protein
MGIDRTVRPPTPRVGLLPSRDLFTRRPGQSGWKSVVLGGSMVLVAVAVFINGLQVDRVTFPFDAPTIMERWNQAATATGRPLLTVPAPELRDNGDGDLLFGHDWTGTFGLRGRVDAESGMVVELSVIGDRDADGGEIIVEAMDLLLRVTEPDLDEETRIDTLQELGVIGGDPFADLAATRGDTDYAVALARDGITIGMSAAPHSSLTSGRR